MLLVSFAQSSNFPKSMKLTISSPSKFPIIHPSNFCANISSLLTHPFCFLFHSLALYILSCPNRTHKLAFRSLLRIFPYDSTDYNSIKHCNSTRVKKKYVCMISLTATQLKKHKVLRAEKAHSQHRLYPVSFPKRQTSPNFHEFRQCFVLVWFPFIYWVLDWIPKAQVTKVKIEKWNSIEEAAAHQGIEENSHKPFIWQGTNIETILKIQKDLTIKTLQIGQGTKNNHFKRHANGQVHENKSGVSLIIREMWLRITHLTLVRITVPRRQK